MASWRSKVKAGRLISLAVITLVLFAEDTGVRPTPHETQDHSESTEPPARTGEPRGYLTTPDELATIADRARAGEEPFAAAVNALVRVAEREWAYEVDRTATCPSADEPKWIDDRGGASRVYAKALAYHLTGAREYAAEVRYILEMVMSTVESIEIEEEQCRLNFAWAMPEFVAAADLIEKSWQGETCVGPVSTVYGEGGNIEGDCKELFQNWLTKNPYYVVSYAGASAQNNWGAAATNAMAYIADYLWDRPDLQLLHREPAGRGDGWNDVAQTPAEAYARANDLALSRMNGYAVELNSPNSCDYLDGEQQHPAWPPVKSQITENGIIPADARRDQHCNIPIYNGTYQNYPQIHLGNLIQQCELMLRRSDRGCYDNVEESELTHYTYSGPDGEDVTTHLHRGRGSVERAINAVIVDSGTRWRRPSALAVAYRYYREHHVLDGVEEWTDHLAVGASAAQDLSFGDLTHALAEGDPTPLPPTVAPPSDD